MEEINQFDLNFEFKKNIGEFIVTFSSIEFSLSLIICNLEFGVSTQIFDHPEIIGLRFTTKIERIQEKIKYHQDPEVIKLWSSIKGKLANSNQFRRSIVHGFVSNSLPNPHITTLKKSKRKIDNGYTIFNVSNEILEKEVANLQDISSGKYGISVLREKIYHY